MKENESYLKPHRIHSRRSSDSAASGNSNKYLEHLRDLQTKAKEILRQNSLVNNFPSPPPLEKNVITEVNLKDELIRVPILLPQSLIQKSTKAKPPMVNLITRTGEVLSVHLLNDSAPIYDPLVRAEAKISKGSLGKSEVLADIRYQGKARLLKSVSPIKTKVNSYELTPPEGLHTMRESTPRGKFERHHFRESELNDNSIEPERFWVAGRMKTYSQHIRQQHKPQTSLKKQLELEILKERMKKDKPIGSKRIRLLKIQ